VIATAEYVWDSRDDAREWLAKPHPELENRPPLEAALTELAHAAPKSCLTASSTAFQPENL